MRSDVFTWAAALLVASLATGCFGKDEDDDEDEDEDDSADGGDGSDGSDGFDSGWDSGDDGGDGGDGSDGTSGGLTSCDWPDIGYCFEWNGYDDAQSWCNDIGDYYEVYVEFHSGEGCPSGEVLACDISGDVDSTDDHEHDVTVYYYDIDYGTAQDYCNSAGGDW